jgi:C4-dicarboxylate-specific signal transduction histidine kinase
MTQPIGSLIATFFSTIGAIALLQLDFEGWTKIIGQLTVIVIALGAIVTTLYYLWNQRSRAHLEKTVTELRADVADLEKRMAKRDAEIVTLKADKAGLLVKLTAERKLRLLQDAKLRGIELPPDHYDDMDANLDRI